MATKEQLAALLRGQMEHKTFVPPNNPVGGALQDYAQWVKPRLQNPLGVLAGEAKRWQNMPVGEMASNLVGVGATAWHGSPHLFDKFKNEAIGTGEGAQAYGHGLYLAEHPDVAKEYQRVLGRPDSAKLTKSQDIAAWAHSSGGVGSNNPVKTLEDEIFRLETNGKFDGGKLKRNDYMEALAMVKQNAAPTQGALYKTDIPDAHIDKMLDWDKPLSEQHPDVQAVVSNVLGKKYDPSLTGDRVYWQLVKHAQNNAPTFKDAEGFAWRDDGKIKPMASDYLHQAGIPGIKYLDGSSRTAGDGTRNFVMFNPDDIRILERNGVPTGLKPWAEDAPKTQYELAHEAARIDAWKNHGFPENNTAMDRAKAMGAKDVYHGTADDIQQIDQAKFGSSTGSKSAKEAFWAVDNPEVATGYAHYAALDAPVKRLLDQADVAEKVAQRTDNWDKYDDLLRQAEDLEGALSNNINQGQNVMPLMVMPRNPQVMDAAGESFVGSEQGINQMLSKSKRIGKDSLIINNLDDAAGRVDIPATHYGVFDPSIVRSKFAAFNMSTPESRNIMAGGALGALGLGTLYNPDDQNLGIYGYK